VTAPLACPVRGCGLLLEPRERQYVCARRHTHDVARSGYVNLLQPQDRRSRDAGDSAEVVRARAAVLEAGVGRVQHRAVVDLAARILPSNEQPVVVDLGFGTGDVLASLAASRPICAIGIDLSSAAADYAAHVSTGPLWVVANADRRLPLLDCCVDVILSIHGRRNPEECWRVLTPGGHAIVAIPSADDLIELREAAQGGRLERSRGVELRAEYAPRFAVRDEFSVRERLTLSPASLRDLLRATYRGARSSASARIAALDALDVTVASDVVLLQRQPATR
jgi:23S rRNA (guanine745-N1)-methyltransferase